MDEQLVIRFGAAAVEALSVTRLVRIVSETLESNLDDFWVAGEVSNARVPASGHFYFTLKDDRSSVSVVMFRSDYQRLGFRVEDGMALMVHGRVNVFEARGALQVVADEIEPRGIGALQIAFEQLKKRLAAEGLFDRARKRAIPFLPRTVGVVTARAGAGLRDIVRVMLDRFPNIHLIVRPARVQGDGAAYEIAEAIADLNEDRRAEVIIVGRGGGSLEDLWAFNEEIVARAIFRSAIPIISAVGHEIDYTIADFVADVRAPTPTAAAQMVVPSMAELREQIAAAGAALATGMDRELSAWRETIDDLASRLKHPAAVVRRARQDLSDLQDALREALLERTATARRLMRELTLRLRAPDADVRELRHRVARLALSMARKVGMLARERSVEVAQLGNRLRAGAVSSAMDRRHRLAELAARLDSLSPLRVFERGYAVVTDARDSRIIVDASTVGVGDELQIRLMKGRLRARTTARET
ncbi:MAG: exodeoxyribonuclease VII large subunit [Candidatus Binataceae bacterium]